MTKKISLAIILKDNVVYEGPEPGQKINRCHQSENFLSILYFQLKSMEQTVTINGTKSSYRRI